MTNFRRMSAVAALIEQNVFARVVSSVALVGLTFLVYRWMNASITPRIDFSVPFDSWVPFLPTTSLVYVSYYVLLPVAAIRVRPGQYMKTLGAVLTANVICWVGFIALPAVYPRPSLSGSEGGLVRSAIDFMWSNDLPGNCFPSIHVATSMLIALRLRHSRGGVWWVAWALAIALSTLTVKQHFVADVIGGLVLALAVNAVFFAPVPQAARPEAVIPPPPSALNVTLALGLLASLLACQWAASRATTPLGLWLPGLIFAFLFLPSYTLLHDAEHGIFHRIPWVNEAFGVMLAWAFPGSFTFLRMCHLGHHGRNRSDVERFDILEPQDNVAARRAYFYFLYLGGFWLVVPLATVLLVVWPTLLRTKLAKLHEDSAAMVGGVSDAVIHRVRFECLGALVVQGAGVAMFGWTWVLLQALGGLCWSSQQYVTHADSPRDALNGAHNLRASRLYEALLLHFNWHLAHHQHPKVPWLHLPSFDDASRKRPPYLGSFVRFWRGPRPTAKLATLPAVKVASA